MDYSINILGKKLEDLHYQDIINFFSDDKEESTILEFKAYSSEYGRLDKNLEGVIRGICGFLNSEGGLLIWGAPEGKAKNGQKEKVFSGELSPLTELIEKDSFINKISDSITPLPVGIDVKVLKDENCFVYVFEIQKSNYPPHQFKNTYYARLDGQTKPAPHYLVEALFKKISFPNLEGFIGLEEFSHDGHRYFLDITVFLFNFSELQNEEKVSFRLVCSPGIFSDSQDSFPTLRKFPKYSMEGHQLIYEDFADIIHFGAPRMHHERLVFNSHQLLTEYRNKVDLVLVFGGKRSPLKSSRYELDFNKISFSNTKKPNYLIASSEENNLFADRKRELGATREQTLKAFLGR